MFLLLAFIVAVFQIRDGTFATPTQSMKSLEIYQDLDNFQNEALLSAIVQNLESRIQHLDNVQYLDNLAQRMEQGNVMIITKSQIEQAKLVAHALQQKHKKGSSDGRRFFGMLYLCIVLPFFGFWFLVTFSDKLTKIQTYYVIFVYIVQGKNARLKKTERKSRN